MRIRWLLAGVALLLTAVMITLAVWTPRVNWLVIPHVAVDRALRWLDIHWLASSAITAAATIMLVVVAYASLHVQRREVRPVDQSAQQISAEAQRQSQAETGITGMGEPQIDPEPERISNLPPRNRVFTGRTSYIADISRRTRRRRRFPIALLGLGGVGKTQIALEYAHKNEENYSAIWLIRAESPVTIIADLTALAGSLGLKNANPRSSDVSAMLAELTSRSGWLLIFDNVPEKTDLYGFLPRGKGDVLITSRSRDWTDIADVIEVEVMSPSESGAFLAKRTERNDPEIGELALQLGYLPLALAQAGGYIHSHNISIARYLTLYKEAAARMLASKPLPANYSKSVATTWLLHFDTLKAERPAAVELLRMCAFFSPERIPLGMLISTSFRSLLPKTLAKAISDPNEWELTIGALVSNSLVDRIGDDTVQVHRLVQEITRSHLNGNLLNAWIDKAISVLQKAFPSETETSADLRQAEDLLSHALAVASRAGERGVCLRQAGQLMERLASYLDKCGECDYSIRLLQRALALNQRCHSRNQFEIALSLTALGRALNLHEEHRYARECFLDALHIARISLKQTDQRWSDIYRGLAAACLGLGMSSEASSYYRKSLSIQKKNHGSRSDETACILIELSNSLAAAGECQPAFNYLIEAYEIDILHHGIIQSFNDLAQLFATKGDEANARRCHECAANAELALKIQPPREQISPIPQPVTHVLTYRTGALRYQFSELYYEPSNQTGRHRQRGKAK